MKFVVVSVHDELYEPLAEYTLYKNKKIYCDKHKYILFFKSDGGSQSCGGKQVIASLPPIKDDAIPMGWGKMFVLREAMNKYKKVDWFFNTDCDAMITNMNVKLEEIVSKFDNAHVIIPADCNGINCGNMFIKNTEIGRAFVDTVIAGMPLYRNFYMFENQLIQDLCVGTFLTEGGTRPGGTLWGNVIRVAPQKLFNSYDYKKLPKLQNRPSKDLLNTDGQWEPNDFIIQWPSTSLEYRIEEAKNMFLKMSQQTDH